LDKTPHISSMTLYNKKKEKSKKKVKVKIAKRENKQHKDNERET
jgi:hypothetical protein